MAFLFWMAAGYLAGSCPTGFLVAKYIKGADIRAFGSGNIGATNVGRFMGRSWAIAVAVFDMLKGGLVVLAASLFTEDASLLAAVGVCAVIGHNYPVWLGLRGGKGVATSFGVIAF
ncbi:MAG: glycerol-3-phosphate acyltransferase, partial [Cloacibacillus sp.]